MRATSTRVARFYLEAFLISIYFDYYFIKSFTIIMIIRVLSIVHFSYYKIIILIALLKMILRGKTLRDKL